MKTIKVMILKFILSGILCSVVLLANAQTREAYTINSFWKFKKLEMDLNDTEFNANDWQNVAIPHTWNIEDTNDDIRGYYRGTAWYKKQLLLSSRLKGKQIFLHFEGANQTSSVYVNGKLAGTHIGGYTAFQYDITDYINWSNENKTAVEIAVKVNNALNEDIPPLSADFTFYGGIYRDVWVIATEPIHFDMSNYGTNGVFVQTPLVSKEKATVKVFGKVKNETSSTKKLSITTSIVDRAGQEVKSINSNLKVKAGELAEFEQKDEQVTGFDLWSPEKPNRYKLRTTIKDEKGNVLDEVTNPLAFRWFSLHPEKGLSLNGEPIKLIGANRHQDYPNLGNAMPDNLHRKDMELLKQMGANHIRIAHYPQDKALVEACDELGIIASIEIPIVNHITESEAFANNCKEMMCEMVRQYYNHPSIAIWTYMNEVRLRTPRWQRSFSGNDTELEKRMVEYNRFLNELAQELHDIAKEEDPYRFTMIPHHKAYDKYEAAGLNDITDIVGWNIYEGWYHNDVENLPVFLKEFHEKQPGKGIIIAEYGTGADKRIRKHDTMHRFDFSIEYQEYYHEYYLKTIQELDFISGGAIWNFADFNSDGRKDTEPNINQKGLLTWDRKPKDSYYLYQAHLLTHPFIKLGPALYEQRTGIQDSAGKAYSTNTIWVYTNLQEVAIFVNGKEIETKKVNGKKVYFDLPFADGKNRIEARGYHKGEVYQDFQEIDFVLLPVDLKSSEVPFKDILINTGAHFNYNDVTKQSWLHDKPYSKVGFGYMGGEPYLRWSNTVPGSDKPIANTQDEPLFQHQRVAPEAYKFDVPQGTYEVELFFCELLTTKEMEQMANNLGAGNDEIITDYKRVFSVDINEREVISNLNLAREVGEFTPYQKKIIVEVNNEEGIEISFRAIEGQAVINGISIRKKF